MTPEQRDALLLEVDARLKVLDKPIVVRDIGRKNLMDIAGRLRELADSAEKNPDAVRTIIVISATNNSVLSVHGYGERCSSVEALGWLTLALDRVRGDRGSEG